MLLPKDTAFYFTEKEDFVWPSNSACPMAISARSPAVKFVLSRCYYNGLKKGGNMLLLNKVILRVLKTFVKGRKMRIKQEALCNFS